MADLAEQLLAAIDETERVARHVLSDYAAHEATWTVPATGVVQLGDDLLPTGDGPLAEHIARHDPASVLRRCEADWNTLSLHRVEDPSEDRLKGFCVHCGWRFPCPDIRNLAQGYGITEGAQHA